MSTKTHQYHITVILGTRPEAIKLAPVVSKLKEQRGVLCEVIATGQHREMVNQVFEVFGLKPDFDLALMATNQNLVEMTTRAINALFTNFTQRRPNLVIAQGDTNTVLAAAMAAFYARIPFAHVEAGLRTGDLGSPWPEEGNRVLVSRLTALHFAPTLSARHNLLIEGVSEKNIFVTGNTVIDALLETKRRLEGGPSAASNELGRIMKFPKDARIILITGHRRESFGKGFENICNAINVLAGRFPEMQFVYPVHLNPNVREPVLRILKNGQRPNVYLIDPLSYTAFVYLMSISYIILTDSGGVQEEAPSFAKPVLVMRNTTERPEAVEAGCAKLVGTEQESIIAAVTQLLSDTSAYANMATGRNPYGDGRASEAIVKQCVAYLDTSSGLR